MIESKELESLLSALKGSDLLSQKKVVRIMQNKISDASNRIQIIEHGILKELLSIARTTNCIQLKQSVLGMLCNLSIEQTSHADLCDDNTLKFLMSLLTSANDTKMQRRVIGLLSNLMKSSSTKTAVGTQDVLRTLVLLLSTTDRSKAQDSKLNNNVACALAKLLNQHYLNQAKFVDFGLDKKLLDINQADFSAEQLYYIESIIKSCSIFTHKNNVMFAEKLAETRLSEVFRGTWNGKQVVIKRHVGTNMSENTAQTTLNEAIILKNMSHPNIIQFYKLLPENALPSMIVMEYACQGALYDYLHSSASIPWKIRLKIALALANGLRYIHLNNVIHGDIKSLNVLLDGALNPKWCDFGFSELRKHALNTSQIQNEQLPAAGTLRWMAPELLTNERSVSKGKKSDIWSLGMVFFEVASRQLPFAEGHEVSIIKEWIMNSDGEIIPEECEYSYSFFAQTMRNCWKKIPRERPNMEEIVETLSQHITPDC